MVGALALAIIGQRGPGLARERHAGAAPRAEGRSAGDAAGAARRRRQRPPADADDAAEVAAAIAVGPAADIDIDPRTRKWRNGRRTSLRGWR